MSPRLLLLLAVAQAAVIGIDLGTECFKISLIQPGKKLEIVENVQSKRTTPTLLAFTDEARMMGAEAQSRASTKPEALVSFFLRLLGQPWNNTELKTQLDDEFIPLDLLPDEDRLTWKVSVKNQKFSIEELVAMVFELAKVMSETQSKGSIKDCAITVPPYWTRAQRQLLIQTAEAAKLHVISLIHENTAAALYYGIDRNDTEVPHHAIFFNLGASKLQVSLVRYTAAVQKKLGQTKTVENIEVLAHAWDEGVGGNYMDALLASDLAATFQKQTGIDAKTNKKAMSKLLNQANKAKRVLSANRNFHVFLDPFMGGKLLNENIERTRFEVIEKPAFERLIKPIETVLKDANLTLGEIDSLEIIGGVTRVPKLQEVLKEYFGKELGMHLNGDEAMAHGAALFAANLTRDIQVKQMWLSDVYPYGSRVEITGLNPNTKPFSKQANLFKKWSKLGAKKQISFTFGEAIKCVLIAEYEKGDMPIIEYEVTGVEEFAKKYEEEPVLYLTFGLDSNGLPGLVSAEARVEILESIESPDTPASNETQDSTNSTQSEDSESVPENSTVPDSETPSEDSSIPEPPSDASNATVSEEAKTKKKVKKLALDLKAINVEFPSPLTPGGVKLTAARLISLAKEDAERRRTAEARNELESYIYFLRERMEEATFQRVTTEEERKKLETLLGGVREWLDSSDFLTATSALVEEKKEKLQAVAKDATDRETEYLKRSEAIEDAFKELKALNSTMLELNVSKTWVSQSDKDEGFKKINETVVWLQSKIEEQAAKKPWESPAFKVTQLKNKLAGAAKAVDKIKRIPKPKSDKKPDPKSDGKKGKKNKLPEFFNFGPGMDGSNIKMENVKIGDEVYNYNPEVMDEPEVQQADVREEL